MAGLCDNRGGPASNTSMRLALLLCSALLCRAAEPAAARWEGAVHIPGLDVPLVIDLAPDSTGQWTGSATLPGFGIKGAPLAGLTVTDSGIAFSLKGALGDPRFTAHLTPPDGLAGDFTQEGNTAPFVLRRTGPPQVEPPRRATAVRKELEGEWRGEFEVPGNRLRARLTLTSQAGATMAKFVVGNKKDTDLPVDFVTEEGEWLTVEAGALGIAFEGRFLAGSNQIAGVFKQGGFETPLVLRRP